MKLTPDEMVTLIVALKDVQEKYFDDYYKFMEQKRLSEIELVNEKARRAKALLTKLQLST